MRRILSLALLLLTAACAAGGGADAPASENFGRVRPGVSREGDVRELLGQPAKVQSFPRQERVAWTYPAPGVQSTLFVVQFSKDGVVREVYTLDDPDYSSGD